MTGHHVLTVRPELTVRDVECFSVTCDCGWRGPRHGSRSSATAAGEAHLATVGRSLSPSAPVPVGGP
jgi:hypothetical protein